MVAQGVHLVLIQLRLVPLAESVDLAGVLVTLLKLEVLEARVVALEVLVEKVVTHTLFQLYPVEVAALVVIPVRVALEAVVNVMGLPVVAAALVAVQVVVKFQWLDQPPVLAVVELVFWVKAQTVLGAFM
jgi:hypothetical protein